MNLDLLSTPSYAPRSLSRLRAATPVADLPPQPGEVVGRGGECQFDAHLHQAPQADAPHPALLLQHPEDRFDQRLAPPIDRSARPAPQLVPHPSVHRMLSPMMQAPAP